MNGAVSTRHYNKLTEKVIEYVAVATAAAMIAFAAWHGQVKSMTVELELQNRPIALYIKISLPTPLPR
ncbi:MAG: hypothetical protein WBV72_12650 [Nitrososphaeraceae archaeon]